MEKAYAQALWKMIDGGASPTKAVHALRDVLKARGREVLFPRIAKAFERIAMREHQRSAMTLTVAHQKDEQKALAAAKKVLSQMNAAVPKHIHTYVDQSLVGGWRLEGADRLIDNSYKKHLLAIYNLATAE